MKQVPHKHERAKNLLLILLTALQMNGEGKTTMLCYTTQLRLLTITEGNKNPLIFFNEGRILGAVY